MKNLVCCAAIALLFTACAKDKQNDPIRNITEAAKDRDLQDKNYQGACTLKPLDAILSGILTGGEAPLKASRTSYRIEGANITRTTQLFVAGDCQGDAAIQFEELGEVDIRKDQKTADGGQSIDIDYKTVNAKVINEDGVKAANAIGLCEATDWVKDQERDVTGAADKVNCYNASLPRHNSNIYRVDNNVLYFGTQSKASSQPEDRPTSLDMNDKYVGQ